MWWKQDFATPKYVFLARGLIQLTSFKKQNTQEVFPFTSSLVAEKEFSQKTSSRRRVSERTTKTVSQVWQSGGSKQGRETSVSFSMVSAGPGKHSLTQQLLFCIHVNCLLPLSCPRLLPASPQLWVACKPQLPEWLWASCFQGALACMKLFPPCGLMSYVHLIRPSKEPGRVEEKFFLPNVDIC